MPNIVPYINFAGKTAAAAEFYKSVFGGDFELQKDGDKVVQMEFTADGVHIMGSDHDDSPIALAKSAGYGLVLNCDSDDQLRELHESLCTSGQEVFAPVDGGWGATVAHCVDRFGVSWMLNFDHA